MKGYSRRFHWHGVERTFFSFTVVAAIRNQRGFDEVRFLRLYDVADIDQLILPRHRGDELEVGVFYHVGHVAAGDRGNRFLPKWGERDDAVVDGIAARLLIGLDQLLKGVIRLADIQHLAVIAIAYVDDVWRLPKGGIEVPAEILGAAVETEVLGDCDPRSRQPPARAYLKS